MNIIEYNNKKYLFVDEFIKGFNKNKMLLDGRCKMKGKQTKNLNFIKGITMRNIETDNGVKVIVDTDILKQYLGYLVHKTVSGGSENKHYYTRRAAVFGRTLCEANVVKYSEYFSMTLKPKPEKLFADTKMYTAQKPFSAIVVKDYNKYINKDISETISKRICKKQQEFIDPLEIIKMARERINRRNALNKKDVSLINYNIELLSKQYSANKETGIKIIA